MRRVAPRSPPCSRAPPRPRRPRRGRVAGRRPARAHDLLARLLRRAGDDNTGPGGGLHARLERRASSSLNAVDARPRLPGDHRPQRHPLAGRPRLRHERRDPASPATRTRSTATPRCSAPRSSTTTATSRPPPCRPLADALRADGGVFQVNHPAERLDRLPERRRLEATSTTCSPTRSRCGTSRASTSRRCRPARTTTTRSATGRAGSTAARRSAPPAAATPTGARTFAAQGAGQPTTWVFARGAHGRGRPRGPARGPHVHLAPAAEPRRPAALPRGRRQDRRRRGARPAPASGSASRRAPACSCGSSRRAAGRSAAGARSRARGSSTASGRRPRRAGCGRSCSSRTAADQRGALRRRRRDDLLPQQARRDRHDIGDLRAMRQLPGSSPLLAVPLASRARGRPRTRELTAGAANADITPPIGTPQFAYTARSRLAGGAPQDIALQIIADPDGGLYAKTFAASRGIHTRVRARAIVLDTGGRARGARAGGPRRHPVRARAARLRADPGDAASRSRTS